MRDERGDDGGGVRMLVCRLFGPILLGGFVMSLWGCTGSEPRALDPLDPAGSAPSLKQFNVPVPQSFTLSNGLPVWFLRSGEIPLVTLSLLIRSGSTSDTPGKEGLCALTAA